MMLESATIAISKDEWALSLYEFIRPAADFKSKRRIQEIRVMRADRPTVFSWDMGDRDLYNRGAIYIPAGIIHTRDGAKCIAPMKIPHAWVRRYEPLKRVGELMDIADEKRAEALPEEAFERMNAPVINPHAAWHDKWDEVMRWRAHRSSFGPFAAIQRN